MSDVDVIIQVHTQGVQQIGNLSASLRNLGNTLRGISVPMSKLDAHTKAVHKALGITSRGVDQHAKSIKELAANQKVLSLESRKLKSDINNLRNAYALAGGSTTQLGREIAYTTKELQAFSKTFRGMRLRAIGSDFQNISLRMSKLGKDAQFVGRSLLINLTLPIATFAKIGLQNFLAVEKQMVRITKVMEDLAPTMDIAAQKILGVSNATAQMLDPQQTRQAEKLVKNFRDMDIAITSLSTKFAVSKDLVASISADFGELGLTAQKNVNALTQLTLEIEKLGNMDVGPAQDLTQALYFQSRRALELTGALSNVTTARERERKAIDASITQMYLFNAIENATALTLKDLGDSFAEVSAMATSYGLSMTEAAAMLAPMKAAGLDVGASANSIKVSLQRLLAPTKQNIDTLKKLAAQYGVAENKQNEFLLSTKTGLTGLEAVVKVFDRVRNSSQGSEGALRLMSDLFEKRQGPRMYLAIEQLSDFNKELRKADNNYASLTGTSTSAEVQLVKAAEGAVSGFSDFNNTIVPKTIRSFKDIGIIARIASGFAGQAIEIEPGKTKFITQADIKNAKAMRQATSDYVKEAKQAKGIDIISEVKTESGRAMMIELAGAANAQQVAQQELDRSLQTTGVAIDRIKNAFKLFAADLISRLAPAIEKISKKVVEMYERWISPEFDKTRQAIANLITGLGSFLAVMGPIILAVGTIQSVIGKLGLGLARFFPKLKNAQGEFIGLGRSMDLARTSANRFYESFVRAAGARSAASTAALRAVATGALPDRPSDVVPPAPAHGGRMSAADRNRRLDNELRSQLRATGASRSEIRNIRALQRTGLSASGVASGMGVSGVHRGAAYSLNARQTEVLRLLEARQLADAVPDPVTGRYRLTYPSGSAARDIDPTDDIISRRDAVRAPADTERTRRRNEMRTHRRNRARQLTIFRRNQFFEDAGITTDRLGTRFIRGGRDITETQAERLALGGPRAVATRASLFARRAVTAPVTAVHGVLQSAVTGAAAAGPGAGGLAKIGKGAEGITKHVLRNTQAYQGASGALAAYNARLAAFNKAPVTGFQKYTIFLTGFIRNMKLATIATRIFKMTLMMTGVIAVIAGIAAVIFLVVKNFDKIKGATKGIDALKRAFNLIKEAVGEIIRPIQDLFASFGSGANEGEKAGNGIAKAFEGLAKAIEFVAGLVKIFVVNVIQPYLYAIVNIVMAVINLFKGNWQEALKFLIAAFAGLIKGIVNLFVGMAKALVKVVVAIVNGILNIFSKIPGMGGIIKGIQNAVTKVGNGIVSIYDKVGKGITGLLDKGLDLGIKKSENKIKVDKKIPDAAKESGELAGEAIADAYGDAPIEGANDKIAGKIKEGIMDAAQKLQDFIADRFANSLKKFISDSVKALNKQKESALKVFNVQLNTLMKLERAEESLTKKKEYETNRRKLIDDATLRGEVYRRNRALAIYEGRIDDARILDLEEQKASMESGQELASLDEGRRKELAKENLESLKEAINDAKELAGKFFDESIEKFQEAAEHITRIAPVTIEQYTAQLNELQTLTTTAADTNNLEFGKMFEKFTTTIAEKMPNAVDDFGKALGAFVTPLDELVNLAQSKYGLGSEDEATVLGVTRKMADAVIGITLGMLVDIGDTFSGTDATDIIEKYGLITGGLTGKSGQMKEDVLANFTTLLEETKTAFLTPYKKALDEADPHTVFRNAIVDGNETILRSFQNMVELNPDLMKRLADSLDPAILKYLKLKAAIDAAKDAAGGGGGGGGGADFTDGFDRAEYNRFMRIREGVVTNFKSTNLSGDAFGRGFDADQIVGLMAYANKANNPLGRVLPSPKRMPISRAEGGPIPLGTKLEATPYGLSGFLNAPEQQGIPAILHGGEFVINADAVKRIGLGALAKLNDPRIPKFKKGGLVGTADQAERKVLAAAKRNVGFVGPADLIERQVMAAAKKDIKTVPPKASTLIGTADAAERKINEIDKSVKFALGFNNVQSRANQVGLTQAVREIQPLENYLAIPRIQKNRQEIFNKQLRQANMIEGLKDDAGGRKLLNLVTVHAPYAEKINKERESLKQDVVGRKLLSLPSKISGAEGFKQNLDKRSNLTKLLDGISNIGAQGGLIDKAISGGGSLLEEMTKTINDTATRAPMSLYNLLGAGSDMFIDLISGKRGPKDPIFGGTAPAISLENYASHLMRRQNDLYNNHVTLGNLQLTNYKGDKAAVNDIFNLLPIGGFGLVGKALKTPATKLFTSELAQALLTSYRGPGANLIHSAIFASGKVGEVAGTHYALHGAERLAELKGAANTVKQFTIDRIVGTQNVLRDLKYTAGNKLNKVGVEKLIQAITTRSAETVVDNRVRAGLIGGNIRLGEGGDTFARDMFDALGERIVSRQDLSIDLENQKLRNVLFTGTQRARKYVEKNNLPDYLAELFTTSELKQINAVFGNLKSGNQEIIRSYWAQILNKSYSKDSDIAMFLAATNAEKRIGLKFNAQGGINFSNSLAAAKLKLYSPLDGPVAQEAHAAAIKEAMGAMTAVMPEYADALDSFNVLHNFSPFNNLPLNMNPAGIGFTPTTVKRTRGGIQFSRIFEGAKTKMNIRPPDLFGDAVTGSRYSVYDHSGIYHTNSAGVISRLPTHFMGYEQTQLIAQFEKAYMDAYQKALGLPKDSVYGGSGYGLLNHVFGRQAFGPSITDEKIFGRAIIGDALDSLPTELRDIVDKIPGFARSIDPIDGTTVYRGTFDEPVRLSSLIPIDSSGQHMHINAEELVNSHIRSIVSQFYDNNGQVTKYGQQKIEQLTAYFQHLDDYIQRMEDMGYRETQLEFANLFGRVDSGMGFDATGGRVGGPMRGYMDQRPRLDRLLSVFSGVHQFDSVLGGLTAIEADTVFKLISSDPNIWKNMTGGGLARQKYLNSATVVQELVSGRAARNKLNLTHGNKPLYDVTDTIVGGSVLPSDPLGAKTEIAKDFQRLLHMQFLPPDIHGTITGQYGTMLQRGLIDLGNPDRMLENLANSNYFIPFLGDSYYQALSEQYHQLLKRVANNEFDSPDDVISALLIEANNIHQIYREFFNPNITDRELEAMLRTLPMHGSEKIYGNPLGLLSAQVDMPSVTSVLSGTTRNNMIRAMPSFPGRLHAMLALTGRPGDSNYNFLRGLFPYVTDLTDIDRPLLQSLGSLPDIPQPFRSMPELDLTRAFDPAVPVGSIHNYSALENLSKLVYPGFGDRRILSMIDMEALSEVPAIAADFPEVIVAPNGQLMPTFNYLATGGSGLQRRVHSEITDALAEQMNVIREPSIDLTSGLVTRQYSGPLYDNLTDEAKLLVRKLVESGNIAGSNIIDLLVPDVAPDYVGFHVRTLGGANDRLVPFFGGRAGNIPYPSSAYPRLGSTRNIPEYPPRFRRSAIVSRPNQPRMEGVERFVDSPYGHFATYGSRAQPLFESLPLALQEELRTSFYDNLNRRTTNLRTLDGGVDARISPQQQDISGYYDYIMEYIESGNWWEDINEPLKTRIINSVLSPKFASGRTMFESFLPYEGGLPTLRNPGAIDLTAVDIVQEAMMSPGGLGTANLPAIFGGYGPRAITEYGSGRGIALDVPGAYMYARYHTTPAVYPPLSIPTRTGELAPDVSQILPAFRTRMERFYSQNPGLANLLVPEHVPQSARFAGMPDHLERVAMSTPTQPEVLNRLRFGIFDRENFVRTVQVDRSLLSTPYQPPQSPVAAVIPQSSGYNPPPVVRTPINNLSFDPTLGVLGHFDGSYKDLAAQLQIEVNSLRIQGPTSKLGTPDGVDIIFDTPTSTVMNEAIESAITAQKYSLVQKEIVDVLQMDNEQEALKALSILLQKLKDGTHPYVVSTDAIYPGLVEDFASRVKSTVQLPRNISLSPEIAEKIFDDVIQNPKELLARLRKSGLGSQSNTGLAVTQITHGADLLRAIKASIEGEPVVSNITLSELSTYGYRAGVGRLQGQNSIDIGNLQQLLHGTSIDLMPAGGDSRTSLPGILAQIFSVLSDSGLQADAAGITHILATLDGKKFGIPFLDNPAAPLDLVDLFAKNTYRGQKTYEASINIIQNVIKGMLGTADGSQILARLAAQSRGFDDLFIPRLSTSIDTVASLASHGYEAPEHFLQTLMPHLHSIGATVSPDAGLNAEFYRLLKEQVDRSRLINIGRLYGSAPTATPGDVKFVDSLINILRNSPEQIENLSSKASVPLSFNLGLSNAQAAALGYHGTSAGTALYLGSGLMTNVDSIVRSAGFKLPNTYGFGFESRTGAELLQQVLKADGSRYPTASLNRIKLLYGMYRDYLSAGKDVTTFLGKAQDELTAQTTMNSLVTKTGVVPFSIKDFPASGGELPRPLLELFEIFEKVEKEFPTNNPLLGNILSTPLADYSAAFQVSYSMKGQMLPLLDALNTVGASSGAISQYAQSLSHSLGLPILAAGDTNINPFTDSGIGDTTTFKNLIAGNAPKRMITPLDITQLNLIQMLKDKVSQEAAAQIGIPNFTRSTLGGATNLRNSFINIVNRETEKIVTQGQKEYLLAGAGILAAGGATLLGSPDKAQAYHTDRMEDYYATIRKINALIASGESSIGIGYDTTNPWYGPRYTLTDKTIREVIDIGKNIQEYYNSPNVTGAVGLYQHHPDYLADRALKAGFSLDTIYSKKVQDKIAEEYLLNYWNANGLGLEKYFENKVSLEDIMKTISIHYRGTPDMHGKLKGGGANKKGLEPDKAKQLANLLIFAKSRYMPGFKKGGFVKGSTNKIIPANLHGGEYVLNANAVKNIGIPALNAINANKPKPPIVPPSREVQRYGEQQRQKDQPWPRGGRPLIPMPQPPLGGWGPPRGNQPGLGGEKWNSIIPMPAMPSNNFRFAPPMSRINSVQAPVTNNVSTVNIQVENFIGQEEWFNSMMKEYNVNVAPRNQKLAGLEQRKFTSYNGINQGM